MRPHLSTLPLPSTPTWRRCAVRMRPDFDRGCYNLGTVCYSYACTLQSELASQYRGIQV